MNKWKPESRRSTDPRRPYSAQGAREFLGLDLPALTVSCILGTVALLPVAILGALAPEVQRDLALTATKLGLTVSLFFVTASAIAHVSGRYVDNVGWARASRTAVAISVASLIATGVAAFSGPYLTLSLLLGAVAFAIAMPASTSVLAARVPAERLGIAFGIKHSFVPLATMMAGALAPFFTESRSWRLAYAAAIIVPLSVLPIISAADRSRPIGGRATSEATANSAALPDLRMATVGMTLGAIVPGALMTFLVSSSVASGLSVRGGGWLLAAVSAAGIAVRLGSGSLVDRRSLNPWRVTAAMLAVGAGGLALMAMQTPSSAVAGGFIAFCAGWGWSGVVFVGVVQAAPDRPGTATGVVQIGGAIGTAAGPLVVGLLIDRLGYAPAWGLVALCAVGGALLLNEAGRSLPARVANTQTRQ